MKNSYQPVGEPVCNASETKSSARIMRRLGLLLLASSVAGSLVGGIACGGVGETEHAVGRSSAALSTGLVISQVYGAGGNSGAAFKSDYVELFNRGPADVDTTGMSIQYASATGAG